MLLLKKTCAPWLLLAFLGLQVSLSSGARRNKSRGEAKTVTAAPDRAQQERRSAIMSVVSGHGKFSVEDTMQCTWVAKDVGDTVSVLVRCEDREARVKSGGVTDMQCQYNGRPHSCPGYRSNAKGFWKQVARSFKRLQGKVCRDEYALVRTAVCKRAPRDAHFKLSIRSISVETARSGEPETPRPPPNPPRSVSTAAAPNATTACTKRANHRKTAEEKCSGAWASVCNFFLSMLQSDDC